MEGVRFAKIVAFYRAWAGTQFKNSISLSSRNFVRVVRIRRALTKRVVLSHETTMMKMSYEPRDRATCLRSKGRKERNNRRKKSKTREKRHFNEVKVALKKSMGIPSHA
ncbi:hypothetical protein CDAR_261271 [Caerostris darwini]|uniref:Uncharacterized protein n=1 Tax=Caerostris darwini TaxID=1538125 RepID=A0AAV4SXL6_9ARAC|nr:hypothetical protein CDAR_261271 [Caerostris darwini]